MFSNIKAVNVVIAGITIHLLTTAAALGQNIPSIPPQGFQIPANVVAALSYPSSSQRFFEEGRAQFEQEVKQLSVTDEQNPPLLTLRPEILEQFENNKSHRWP